MSSPSTHTLPDSPSPAKKPLRPAAVVGNGPSLRGFDLSRLQGYDVFGMNAAYRHWDEIGWYPQYYACLDTVVGLSHAEAIARLIERSEECGIRLFLLRENLIRELGHLQNHWRIVNFDEIQPGTRLLRPLPVTTGSHTLAWAVSLGYRSVALLGMDCSYQEIVPGATVVEGAVLEITEEKENPNYFFDGYQRKGDRYHIPNVGFDVHLGSWRSVAEPIDEVGARILNANPVSRVDAFDFCDPDSLFLPAATAPDGFRILPVARESNARPIPERRLVDVGTTLFRRSDQARISETDLVARLTCRGGKGGVLFDVGAHVGSSAAPFVKAGWKAYCFEPDETNRARLEERFGSHPGVVIDPRGIANEESPGRSFYRSEVSSGISSLVPFHESHASEGQVAVTTVARYLDEHDIGTIDFLKIDVEGMEMAVLEGVPWDRCKPRVIECEFEDAKTVPLGHNWQDLAAFLLTKGYTVYASEWHPIIRYGIPHDWRGLKQYPCELEEAAAWGNLIAFLDDPGHEVLSVVATQLVQLGPHGTEAVKAARRLSAARSILREQQEHYRSEWATAEARLKQFRSSPWWIFQKAAWDARVHRNTLRDKIASLKDLRRSLDDGSSSAPE